MCLYFGNKLLPQKYSFILEKYVIVFVRCEVESNNRIPDTNIVYLEWSLEFIFSLQIFLSASTDFKSVV